MRRFTPEEDTYIRDNWKTSSDEDIAKVLGRSKEVICNRRHTLGLKHRESYRGPNWSERELEYIRSNWGEKTIPQIAKALGRTITSVKVKSQRMGLKGQKWYGEMMSARKVSELLGVDVHTVCDHWIPQYGLKGSRKRLGESKKTTTIIMFEDLLKWLEENQDRWDSRRVELYALGMEYDWLVKKRKADAEKPVRKAQKWTPSEDSRLIALFKRGDMTYAEIGKELGRSSVSVEHRLGRLDVWGTGKYVGDRTKGDKKEKSDAFEKKCLIVRLRNALLIHRNSMEYGEFWQKDLCLNWNDIAGCLAGCTDCDSCSEFRKIPPQYCARCGITFFERVENRFCKDCRIARKKRAQRHWMRVNEFSRK